MARLIQKAGTSEEAVRQDTVWSMLPSETAWRSFKAYRAVTKNRCSSSLKTAEGLPDAKELFEYADYPDTQPGYGVCVYCCCVGYTHLHELN